MSDFTPGPWSASTFAQKYPDVTLPDGRNPNDYWFISGGDGINPKGLDIGNWLSPANARLIAAAPDMFTAIRDAQCPHDTGKTTVGECIHRLECQCDLGTALSKAMGVQR